MNLKLNGHNFFQQTCYSLVSGSRFLQAPWGKVLGTLVFEMMGRYKSTQINFKFMVC